MAMTSVCRTNLLTLLPLEEEVGQGNKRGYGYDTRFSDKPPDAPPPRRGGGPR
jgi:hypothetical protein